MRTYQISGNDFFVPAWGRERATFGIAHDRSERANAFISQEKFEKSYWVLHNSILELKALERCVSNEEAKELYTQLDTLIQAQISACVTRGGI